MFTPIPRPQVKLTPKPSFGSPFRYAPDPSGARNYPYVRRTLAAKDMFVNRVAGAKPAATKTA